MTADTNRKTVKRKQKLPMSGEGVKILKILLTLYVERQFAWPLTESLVEQLSLRKEESPHFH